MNETAVQEALKIAGKAKFKSDVMSLRGDMEKIASLLSGKPLQPETEYEKPGEGLILVV